MSDIQKISKAKNASNSGHQMLRNSDNADTLSIPSFPNSFNIQISNLLFYLLILFLPTQLGYHFWPDFSFVSGIRIDYLAPTIYLTDILVLLLFVTWLLSIIKFSIFNFSRGAGSLRQFSIKSKFKNLNFSNISIFPAERDLYDKFQIGFLIAIILIGIMFSKSPPAGIYGLIKLIEFVFLGFYTAFNIKKLRFSIVLVLLSIGIIFESLLSVAQYLNQASVGGILYFFGERTFNGQTPGIANASIAGELILRPYGTFPHPNVLAGYLIIAMAIVISNIKYLPARQAGQISNIMKTIFIAALAFGTVALFLTMSRMAILLWLAILLFWYFKKVFSLRHSGNQAKLEHPESLRLPDVARRFWTSQNDGNNLRFSILLLLLLAGSVFFLSPLNSRFINIKLTDESIVVREKLMNSSFMMTKDHPLFGVGLNNFLVELPHYQKINNYFVELQPVHNIFLLVAAETGIVGLGFFLWFIGKTYQRIMNQEARIKQRKFIPHNSYFIILSSILVLGLFDHYFLTLQQGQLFFSFIVGLSWANMKK